MKTESRVHWYKTMESLTLHTSGTILSHNLWGVLFEVKKKINRKQIPVMWRQHSCILLTAQPVSHGALRDILVILLFDSHFRCFTFPSIQLAIQPGGRQEKTSSHGEQAPKPTNLLHTLNSYIREIKYSAKASVNVREMAQLLRRREEQTENKTF